MSMIPVTEAPANASLYADRKTVMLVDDEDTVRLMLRKILEHAGWTVVSAASPAAALELLPSVNPDLFVLDYLMPGMTGASLAAQIRQNDLYSNTPVLVLTSSGLDEDLEKAFAAGVDDYLLKPVPQRLLLSRIQMAREAHSQRKAATQYRARLSDIQEASELQQARLPRFPRAVAGLAISGAVVPCDLLGGDFIDLLTNAQGEHVVALIDVSGHGTASAMLSFSISTELRMLLQSRGILEAIEMLNRQIAATAHGLYACVCLVEFRKTGARLINAGLPPVTHLRAGEVIAQYSGNGTPPGLIPEFAYSTTAIDWQPGDRLVLVSDGLTEPFGVADDVGPMLERFSLRVRPLPSPDELRAQALRPRCPTTPPFSSSTTGANHDHRPQPV
jgi:phosphoserine phosphatase RsbU/P